MLHDISVAEAFQLDNPLFIDVRSPAEFAEDTIPGAINIPILDNEERRLVGILYKEKGSDEARRFGMEIVAPKLPKMVNEYMQYAGNKLVIFCWRGGLRSRAIAQVLQLMNLHVYRLEGGYKAYRRYVINFFDQPSLPQKIVVIRGLTGVGKTEVLDILAGRSVPTIDLETMANNRGSVFGNVGLGTQPSQKYFESQLFAAFRRFAAEKFIVVEGESRRIGKLFIPSLLFQAMQQGPQILLFDTLANRVKRIVKEYTQGPNQNKEALKRSVSMLSNRLGKHKVQELNDLIDRDRYQEVVKYLLENYYDPLYRHPDQPDKQYDLNVDAGNIELAAEKIEAFCYKL